MVEIVQKLNLISRLNITRSTALLWCLANQYVYHIQLGDT